MTTFIDSMLIPKEYMAKESRTATEVKARLCDFYNSIQMERLGQVMDAMLVEVIAAMCQTPIQFRFPVSKKKRIRKKWRKDPRNFRRLLDTDQFEDIQIIA